MKNPNAKLSLQYFDIHSIALPEYQPRKDITHAELQELADNIMAEGLIQPLYVYMDEGRPILVAGERRWRAAQLANLSQVPCIVSPVKLESKQRFVLAMSENLHRVDLSHWEMAESISKYQEEFKLTLNDIVALHGGSVSKWSRYLKIKKAFVELQEAVKNKQINSITVIGLLIDIEKIDPDFAKQIMQDIIDEAYTGTAEEYARLGKERVKAADDLGYMPPEPDALGRFDESHSNVIVCEWKPKTSSNLTIKTLQIAKNQWVGGYSLTLGKNKMEMPLSLSFTGATDCEVKGSIAAQNLTYCNGLLSRTKDMLTRQDIEKLKVYLSGLVAKCDVEKQHEHDRPTRQPKTYKPERISRCDDQISILFDKKEINLDIKALQALL